MLGAGAVVNDIYIIETMLWERVVDRWVVPAWDIGSSISVVDATVPL